jgi:hypothetical protein
VMIQVVLSGGIFPLHGKVGLEEVSWVAPSRWGYAATAATADLNKIMPSSTAAASLPHRTPILTAQLRLSASPSPTPAVSPSPSASTGAAPSSASGTTTTTDPLWDHTGSTWLTDMGVLLALALFFCLLTWRRLIKMRPLQRR